MTGTGDEEHLRDGDRMASESAEAEVAEARDGESPSEHEPAAASKPAEAQHESSDDTTPPATASGDPVLDVLWQNVLSNWDDPKRHALCLDHALREESLAALAKLYRSQLDDASRREVVDKRLSAIVAAATNAMVAKRMPRRTRTPWWLTLSALVTTALILFYLAAMILGR